MGNRPHGVFIPPRNIERLEIDPESGALAISGCPSRKSELFLVGTEPNEICDGRGIRAVAAGDREREIKRKRRRQGRRNENRKNNRNKNRNKNDDSVFGWLRELF
jgi:membrane carboxypeptidase/penicillin-binding protein